MSSIITSDNITINFNGTQFVINSTNYTVPLTISNLSDSPIIVTLAFANTLTNSSQYLIVNSSNITFDGLNVPINISATNYNGLIKNTNSANTNILINNIIIDVITSEASATNGGWLCQSGFNNGIVNNCSSNGNINTQGGGIFGANANNCITNMCFSNGDILSASGGIFGYQTINCTANNCFSTGSILYGSGGIFGANCNESSIGSNCTANGCYSTGLIGALSTYNAGGIFGNSCNFNTDSSVCEANFCFSTGDIYGDDGGGNGGIFGVNSASNCIANSCYSLGSIGMSCGGIFYSGATHVTATNCYAMGSIGVYAGGIFGPNANHCEASYCYSTNNIQGGGIFGFGTFDSVANKCYSLGTLIGEAGSLFAISSSGSSADNCYVLNGTTSQFFADNIGSITNCRTEDGGSWDDSNASNTILTSDYISVSPNTPFLLRSFSDYGSLNPYGYQYFYGFLNGISNEITSNGLTTYVLLNGYYLQPQDTIDPSSIYGYTLINFQVDVNVPAPVPPTPPKKHHHHHKHHTTVNYINYNKQNGKPYSKPNYKSLNPF